MFSLARSLGVLAIVLIFAVSCSAESVRTAPRTSATSPGTTTTTQIRPADVLAVQTTVDPDQGVAGASFTFKVVIRGPGTLSSEEVHFGDGQTSGANAGLISCGQTRRADRISTYTHMYAQPGTYVFSNDVSVLGPPPSCRYNHAVGSLTLIVSAPLSSATLNGAFLSPTKNIACYIDAVNTNSVRCATFSPPQLVTMGATGSFRTCTGRACDLGNPAPETPVLAYGSATGGGAFQCLSRPEGVTCTVVGHRGFTISRSGIRPAV